MKITNQSHNQSYPVKPWHRRLFSDYGPRALIFGASEGIGLAFAEELAKAGFHLLLVARRREVLKKAADNLDFETAMLIRDEINQLKTEMKQKRGKKKIK